MCLAVACALRPRSQHRHWSCLPSKRRTGWQARLGVGREGARRIHGSARGDMGREPGSRAEEGLCDAVGGHAGQVLFGCAQCELAVGWAGQGSCGRGARWAGGRVRRALSGCVGRGSRCDVRCGLWRASAGCREGGLRASCVMRLRIFIVHLTQVQSR